MKRAAIFTAVGFLVGLAKPVQADLSCADWMTEAFFGTATAQDVRKCLEAGAPSIDRDQVGRTPLHLAAAFAVDAAVVAELLRAGAAADLTDSEGRRPIHVAAEMGGTPGILSYLLVWGSDPDIQLPGDRCSWRSIARCATSPLHLAAARSDGAEHVAALLAADADPDSRDEEQRTALHLAAANSIDGLSVEVLLKAGAKHDLSDLKGLTPLHVAARRPEGAPEIVNALLAAGASADEGDTNSTTPVMWAARAAPNSMIVATLIEAAKKPCDPDKQERTVLNLWDQNENLERDTVYWALHDQCSK